MGFVLMELARCSGGLLLQSFYNFGIEAEMERLKHGGMKRGKCWLIFGLWLCAATVMRAGLLEEVIRKPGTWNQMCAMPMPLDFDVPLPMYSLATARNFFLSPANLDRLQEQRAVVGADIVSLLNRMDLSKATNNSAQPVGLLDSNQDPEQLSGTLLDIILQLDVVEALPGLLRVEADLNQRLSAAKTNDASLPALDLGGPVMFSGVTQENFKEQFSSRRRSEFTARVYQREMLSVMAALLRHERYQPLLDSDLEKSYFGHLKQNAGNVQLERFHSAADIPSNQKGWIGFDTVHGLPFFKDQYHAAFVPYTPELRQDIRKWAADYLQQTSGKKTSAASTTVK